MADYLLALLCRLLLPLISAEVRILRGQLRAEQALVAALRQQVERQQRAMSSLLAERRSTP